MKRKQEMTTDIEIGRSYIQYRNMEKGDNWNDILIRWTVNRHIYVKLRNYQTSVSKAVTELIERCY